MLVARGAPALFVLAALLAATGCHRSPPPGGLAAPSKSCRTTTDCDANAYCAYTPALCGKGSHAGICRLRKESCTAQAPVCGCDGNVHADECAAHVAGVALAEQGGCKPVTDFIPCGEHYCDARTSYCEIYLSDVLEPPTTHACRQLPASCVPALHPDCTCFPRDTPCMAFCGPMWTGGVSGFHLTCQGVQVSAPRSGARVRDTALGAQ